MEWVVFVLAAVGVPLLWQMMLPGSVEPPRWRRRLAEGLEHVAARVRGRRPVEPDPFVALRVQLRLAALSHELQWLEDAPVYARAHRMSAVRAAYDDLLLEACLLAGVEIPPDAVRGAVERWREESALTERGWSW